MCNTFLSRVPGRRNNVQCVLVHIFHTYPKRKTYTLSFSYYATHPHVTTMLGSNMGCPQEPHPTAVRLLAYHHQIPLPVQCTCARP